MKTVRYICMYEYFDIESDIKVIKLSKLFFWESTDLIHGGLVVDNGVGNMSDGRLIQDCKNI